MLNFHAARKQSVYGVRRQRQVRATAHVQLLERRHLHYAHRKRLQRHTLIQVQGRERTVIADAVWKTPESDTPPQAEQQQTWRQPGGKTHEALAVPSCQGPQPNQTLDAVGHGAESLAAADVEQLERREVADPGRQRGEVQTADHLQRREGGEVPDALR